MESGLFRQLVLGLDELGIALSPERSCCLLEFLSLLSKWNKVYNLTAIRDPADMLSHHLLDSLSVSPYLCGQRVLDIGTGPGLPGIPLSILHAGKSFVLIDSNGKKTRFVRQAVLELGLSNVEVVQERVDRFQNELLFDTMVTRAYSAMPGILSGASHLLKKGGRILAMRGRMPDQPIDYPGFKASIIPTRVPGLHAERHILMLTSDLPEPRSDG